MLRSNAKTRGSEVQSVWIGAGLLRARILRFGATLQDLRLDPVANPLVLSLPDAAYRGAAKPLYAGAVIGRVAGRIAKGRAMLGRAELVLPVNAAPHHLHGGEACFGHRDWQFIEVTEQSAKLEIYSPAGEGGYPGNVHVTATYEVREDATLALTLEAQSDVPTLLNLCHHPYFNLSGAETVNAHRLQSPAKTYLPADADALPTGQIAPVAGTHFDFSEQRAFGSDPYDNSLCLHHAPTGPLAFAGRLSASASAPEMEIWTTQPALHVYDGQGIGAVEGVPFGARAGVALEAQGWPDAPNNPAFPSINLDVGTSYRQATEYRFFS